MMRSDSNQTTFEFSKPPKVRKKETDLQAEIARLKHTLKPTEQERNILKEAVHNSLCQS